jgi:HD-GYP domain-containing protein (c-di-GMP phosphodiesterase class II)
MVQRQYFGARMALKKISTSQVEMGMYIHGFEGNLLNHPFWRARFVVADEDKLQTLRTSRIDAIIIDTELGIDVARREAVSPVPVQRATRPDSRPPRPAPAMPRPATGNASAFRSGPVQLTREFGNARSTADKARKVISKIFLEARHGNAPRVVEVAPVVEDIYASIQRNPYAFSGLMRCKADNEAIYQHMLSVSALMISLARQMKLSPQETRLAGMAGLLLDVGVSRIGIDLNGVDGRIDRIDPQIWQWHTSVGRELLAAAEEVEEDILRVVMNHHERLDGTGFPQALSGKDIDRYSRMAAICDTYDHMVSGALDGRSADPAEAMSTLLETRGAFDADILARFVEAMGVYPVGSFVLLRSERIALVIDQNPSEPAVPTVRVFFSLKTRLRIPEKTIVLSNCFGEDGIIGVADLDGLDLPSPELLREHLITGKRPEK